MTASTEDKKNSWPDFYPDDINLPPLDSIDANGVFYRFVKFNPPTEKCFASTHEDQPKKHHKCKSLEEKECVYGTTFWANKDSIIRVKETLAEAFKDRMLATGNLSPKMGKMKKTLEEYHYTVWLKKDSNVHTVFSEVKE